MEATPTKPPAKKGPDIQVLRCLERRCRALLGYEVNSDNVLHVDLIETASVDDGVHFFPCPKCRGRNVVEAFTDDKGRPKHRVTRVERAFEGMIAPRSTSAQFGLQISGVEWRDLAEAARSAETLGFDCVMLPDHIVHEGPEKQHDPHALSYDPILQAGIMAASTKKLRIGHLVLCNLFRHPVFTAQAVMSLDQLSGGRAFLGLGTGWTETEFRMTGIPFPDIGTRLRMLDEALTCIRGLWTQEATTFAGEFYQLKDAILFPKPLQKPYPPIVLGGGGKGLLRLAAKHADVVNIMTDVGKAGYIKLETTRRFDDAAFKEKVRFVREETERLGREPKAVKISHVIFSAMIAESADMVDTMAQGAGAAFGVSADEIRRSPIFLIGTPAQCAEELSRRIREWELSEVVFSGQLAPQQLDLIAREILPAIE